MTGLLQRLLLLLTLVVSLSSYSQQNIDSLITVSQTFQADTSKIIALQELSWALKSSKPDKAIEYASQALDLSRIHKYVYLEAKSLKHIATAHLFAGNFNKSENYFLAAIEIFARIKNAKGESSCYNNLGLVFEYKGDYAEATQAYKRSLNIDRKINNQSGVAASLSNIGNVLQKKGNYGQALKNYIESLKIRDELNDIKGIAVVYNNIGAIHEKQESYDEAIKNYKNALSKYILIGEQRQSAIALNNIGYVYYLQNKYDNALNYYNRALEIREKVSDNNGIASTLSNIANVFLEQNKYNIALEYLNKSENYYKSIDNKYEINKVKITKAKYYLKQKAYNKVIKLLNIVVKDSNIQIEHKKQLYRMLSMAYFGLAQYKQAFIIKEKFAKLKDSLDRYETSKKIIQLQLQYEFDKKQKELEILQEKQKLQNAKELVNKKIINWILITCLIALLLIIILIYRSYVIKKQDNKLLLFQKRQIEIINKELVSYQNKLVNEKQQLEQQKQIVTIQKDKIAEQRLKIIESVQYAKKIQDSILPSDKVLRSILKSYFLIYKPKDIVSGDFYWLCKTGKYIFVVVADGTGHGVSGSFISLLGISLLNELVNTITDYDSIEIINSINTKLQATLQQNLTNNDIVYGVDMGLCIINTELMQLQYSGTNSSLLIINNGKASEIQGNKIVNSLYNSNKLKLNKHIVDIKDDDKFFLYTNGFGNQFGGVYNQKFTNDRLKRLLLSNSNKDMKSMRKNILSELEIWMDGVEQVDDILILGFTSKSFNT